MVSATVSSKEFQFRSSDGLAIACFRWDARGPSRGSLQIAHGLGEHIGRYDELITVLQEAGLVVYGHDHRGHGRTVRSPEEFGDYGEGGFDLLVEDMAELTRIAKEENPGQPLLLLGHSMGSLRHSNSFSIAVTRSMALSFRDRACSTGWSASLVPLQKYNFLNAAFEPARTTFD